MNKTMASLLLTAVAVAALSSGASAQKRKPAKVLPYVAVSDGEAIPLTVNRRSWLDPGNAVSTTQTAGPSYIAANTVFNKTQDRIFAPDGFGNDVTPGQPYIPGPSRPVLEGSALPNGRFVVDNALFPQNFYLNPATDLP